MTILYHNVKDCNNSYYIAHLLLQPGSSHHYLPDGPRAVNDIVLSNANRIQSHLYTCIHHQTMYEATCHRDEEFLVHVLRLAMMMGLACLMLHIK